MRLLGRSELATDYDPIQDSRRSVWKLTHQLIGCLDRSEEDAGDLLRLAGRVSVIALVNWPISCLRSPTAKAEPPTPWPTIPSSKPGTT